MRWQRLIIFDWTDNVNTSSGLLTYWPFAIRDSCISLSAECRFFPRFGIRESIEWNCNWDFRLVTTVDWVHHASIQMIVVVVDRIFCQSNVIFLPLKSGQMDFTNRNAQNEWEEKKTISCSLWNFVKIDFEFERIAVERISCDCVCILLLFNARLHSSQSIPLRKM